MSNHDHCYEGFQLSSLCGPQSNYDKMKSEVPKYKMITPSILADRLRVGAMLGTIASHHSE